MVILGTTQTHSLGAKAALILGFEFVAIETRAEDEWALRGEALEKALRELEEKRKKPFILSAPTSLSFKLNSFALTSLVVAVATLGSTSTGAIDNIAEITSVSASLPSFSSLPSFLASALLPLTPPLASRTAAAHPSLFLHIDAAWGGVFLSLPECRDESFLDAINARAVKGAEEGAICAGGEVHSFCTNLHK